MADKLTDWHDEVIERIEVQHRPKWGTEYFVYNDKGDSGQGSTIENAINNMLSRLEHYTYTQETNG